MPRWRIRVDGVVQGVGFRPFVYRIARARALTGWVRNRPEGVEIEVQGPEAELRSFREALEAERPAPARLRKIDTTLQPEFDGEAAFEIRASAGGAETRPSVPADLATCPECAQEIRDPRARRFRYPFTNCTYCGPRFTIIAGMPYDRPRTSMRGFPLCPDCGREYGDPLDRRFHAQPVACPVCGPRLRLLDSEGRTLAETEDALAGAVRALAEGRVLGLKGIGGWQLLVDALQEAAVGRLRERKLREEKPFAVMFPDLDQVRAYLQVREAEARLLQGAEAPILLLHTREATEAPPLASNIAPRNPYIGAFLPYSPLHHLLLADLDRPLVCTSGNVSEEPMVFEDEAFRERLGGIADLFLAHDRPILRPVDDSVLRLDAAGPTILRRARGYAPLAQAFLEPAPAVLALGAHQKSTVALASGGQVVVSQHLGDLQSPAATALLARTVADLLDFLQIAPERLACDLHPDYASTRLAERLAAERALDLVRVQHHHAHVAAVMAEHGVAGPVLGLAWDGTGLGPDGSIWGGEFLVVDPGGYRRVAHLAPFRLPGGEQAIREPCRAALGLLHAFCPEEAETFASAWFSEAERRTFRTVLERGLNAPLTSSVGRLFDAVAAIAGIRAGRGFEGQAAMELEYAAHRSTDADSYPWGLLEGDPLQADPRPLLEALREDLRRGRDIPGIARRFHNSLADLALAVARRVGIPEVVLSGGCFQNGLLMDGIHMRLEAAGFRVLRPSAFPPNDGAISLGQAWVAAQEGRG